ncbi:response regulator transcription factor [Streptomyces sp. NBC_00878]|uniref:response regulator transcription factor n=1 Tax=Streptomyces sp. NBC_00878 TaxID=2975854 RepID=UPI00224D1451|nr:response regulator transcription factor [Streptomyces sp. NBC_00878]MCX4903715.1 response regulator transcription factor [Streptomyces sp. NBC_00878]
MSAYVLVAEDDVKQAEVIRRYLEREGHTALVVNDGRAAIDEVRRRQPDLLVLDVMLPLIDGLDVCRVLRRECDVLVLMLTARRTEADLLLGLDLGADDYMTKPYSPRELMARIRTLLRRTRATTPDDPVLRIGALTIDPVRRTVGLDGRPVVCTPGEFEILAAMATEPERVFTRRQLLTVTRGFDRYITERTVDVHILNLRKKIEAVPGRPAYLQTVFGVGYKLTDGSSRAH